MTELADTLVREEKLSFKMAHRLVANTVKKLPGIEAAQAEIIDALFVAATEVGIKLTTPRQKLTAALDPLNFVEVRTIIGGPAPKTVEKFLQAQEKIAANDRQWQTAKETLLLSFPKKITLEKRAI